MRSYNLTALAIMVGIVGFGLVIYQSEFTPIPVYTNISPSSLTTADTSVELPFEWRVPANFPIPLVPQDNAMTEAKFQLGRHFFYDKRLSGNGTMSCASCHFQHLAFTDGLSHPIGSTGDQIARNSMSIANAAYYPTLTWANPSLYSLERQAQVPLFVENTGVELGVNDQNKQAILERFNHDLTYQRLYKAAFPNPDSGGVYSPINFSHIIKALASFQRGLISANSRFDQAQRGEIQLTPVEKAGQALFYGQGQCGHCHSGFNFSNQTFHANSTKINRPFHNTGLYNLDGQGRYPDGNSGLIDVMPGDANMGKFRVPSLRNIALTAPYMHDGSIATLEDVVQTYAQHGRLIETGPHKGDGRLSPLKDALIDQIQLDAQEQQAIIQFLHTLTDKDFIRNPRFSDPFLAEVKTP